MPCDKSITLTVCENLATNYETLQINLLFYRDYKRKHLKLYFKPKSTFQTSSELDFDESYLLFFLFFRLHPFMFDTNIIDAFPGQIFSLLAVRLQWQLT